jgi:hypothetical protein
VFRIRSAVRCRVGFVCAAGCSAPSLINPSAGCCNADAGSIHSNFNTSSTYRDADTYATHGNINSGFTYSGANCGTHDSAR